MALSQTSVKHTTKGGAYVVEFPGKTMTAPVAASQVIKEGNLITLATTQGYATLCATDTDTACGIALMDVTTTAANELTVLSYISLDTDTIFELPAASTATATATAQAIIGLSCNLVLNTAIHAVNVAASTHPTIRVIGLSPKEALGTSGGRYLCRIPDALLK